MFVCINTVECLHPRLSAVGGHVLILHLRLCPLLPRQFLHERLHASDKPLLFHFGELVADASLSKPL